MENTTSTFFKVPPAGFHIKEHNSHSQLQQAVYQKPVSFDSYPFSPTIGISATILFADFGTFCTIFHYWHALPFWY